MTLSEKSDSRSGRAACKELARACGRLQTALLLAERVRVTNPTARQIRERIVADIQTAHALALEAYLQLGNLGGG